VVDSCIIAKAKPRSDGYAKTAIMGKMVYVHRLAYQLAYGYIPEGLTIDHLCKVRNCIHPRHLEAVSLQENLARKKAEPCTHTPIRRNKRNECMDCANERNQLYRLRKKGK
jgi:hypothetical protein